MPPEDTNAGDPQNNQQDSTDKNLPTTIEGWQKLAEAREKRLRESEDKNKRLSGVNSTLDERIKAIETANQERLAKQGDFQELAQQRAAEIEKYKPLAERASALEAIIRESNEARVKTVPDAMKALIPTDYPPEKLQTWLNANEALLVKPPAPDYDAGAGAGSGGGNQSPKLTDEERAMAKAMRMTDKQYSDMKQQRGQPIELVKKPTTP